LLPSTETATNTTRRMKVKCKRTGTPNNRKAFTVPAVEPTSLVEVPVLATGIKVTKPSS
jgi:hypothetical protein